jgi:hypothetical protein
MSHDSRSSSVARRSFLSKVGVGAAALGATIASELPVAGQTSGFQPARHAADDWLELPGRHRFVLDALTPAGADDGRRYANNVFTANKSGYGVESKDLAVVLILRHQATAFAYNDAMWAKYGAKLSEEMKFTDPKTNQAPTTNLHNTTGVTLPSLIALGVHFAVCGMATRRLAGILARGGNGDVETIFQELSKNLIPNAHLVPAGIVLVGRAQERGYAFAYVG